MAIATLFAGGSLSARQSASAPLAQQLVEALERAELDSIAAPLPDAEDRFVAALFFPGRLLVVSARYEAPVYVVEKIAAKNYREVYIDLSTASLPDSRVVVIDGGANGLDADDAGDSVDAGGQLVRGGDDWAGFSEADANYTSMLQALLSEID